MSHPSEEEWLNNRAATASHIREPVIDVSERVLITVSQYSNASPAVDKTPLFVGGGLLAIAASSILLLLPSLTLLTEPWISFWLI